MRNIFSAEVVSAEKEEVNRWSKTPREDFVRSPAGLKSECVSLRGGGEHGGRGLDRANR